MGQLVSMSYGEWCRRQVRVGDRLISLSNQQHKLVVALLAKHPEHWTQCSQLIDDLYLGCIVPDQWHKVINTMCHQLRARGVPIEGRPGRATGGIRIYRRGRSELGCQVSHIVQPSAFTSALR